ncbi:MAG: hypothetical protein ACLQUY_22500 [Ktedonobacterales bacterium]
MHRSYPTAVFLALLILLLPLSACGQDSAVANQLDVTMTLVTGETTSNLPTSSPDKTDIEVIFHQNGNELFGEQDLTSGESFTCNGTSLPLDDSLAYTFRGFVGEQAPGGAYSCVYARDGSDTQFTLPATQRLSVQSPSANVDIPLSQDLTVTFTPDPGAQVSAEVYSRLTNTWTSLVAAQPGATTLTIPAAMLAQFGGQSVSLNVLMTTPLHVPASGFRSLTATAEDVLAIPLMIG